MSRLLIGGMLSSSAFFLDVVKFCRNGIFTRFQFCQLVVNIATAEDIAIDKFPFRHLNVFGARCKPFTLGGGKGGRIHLALPIGGQEDGEFFLAKIVSSIKLGEFLGR